MTEIVKTFTSFITCAVVLFGIYIVFYGHLSPGGGFAGGLIIAFMFILLILANGTEGALKKLPPGFIRKINIAGLAGVFLFFILAVYRHVLGIGISGGREFSLLSAKLILPLNIAVCLKVSAGILMAFIALSAFRGSDND